MIRCVRMWTGDDGNTVFEEGMIGLAHREDADRSTLDLAAGNFAFRETPPGSDYDWHQDPVPRLVLTLRGIVEFTVTSGRTFVICPGDVLLAEDNRGMGHRWCLLDDQPWQRAYVVVPDITAIPFVRSDEEPA